MQWPPSLYIMRAGRRSPNCFPLFANVTLEFHQAALEPVGNSRDNEEKENIVETVKMVLYLKSLAEHLIEKRPRKLRSLCHGCTRLLIVPVVSVEKR